MKCIKNISTGEISRVSDSIADQSVVVERTHVYINKTAWKEAKAGLKK